MEDGNFDVIIIGTGLAESIAAAALSKNGYKVAHIDENSYYGGNEACLSLDELAQWVDTMASSNNPRYTSLSRSPQVPSQHRQYSICLSPSVIPSIGPVISCLISSGVAKYGGFRLLERVGVYQSGVIKHVPGSKEDVFKSKDISLIDKRRLMRFLKFATGDFEKEKEFEAAGKSTFSDFLALVFSLKGELQSALVYALAFSFIPTEPAVPALHRLRRYLFSLGRYGPSPFLVGHYGGTGEIAQGFCRASAVSSGVYILGRRITSLSHSSTNRSSLPDDERTLHRFSLTLDDFPETLTSHVIISSASHLPPDLSHLAKHLSNATSPTSSFSIARGVVILDKGIIFPVAHTASNVDDEEGPSTNSADPATELTPPTMLDAGVIVFPPSSVSSGSTEVAATVLVTGEGTMSTPKGKWILYISLPLSAPEKVSMSAEQILKPYVDATLALTAVPAPANSTPSEVSASPSSQATVFPSQSDNESPESLFAAYYIEHPSATSLSPGIPDTQPKPYIVPTPLAPAYALPELPDAAATSAEAVFWEAVKTLRKAGIPPTQDDVDEIESFWPPTHGGEDSEEED